MGATHVALIRGINVGKAKRVAMADLRRLLAGLGYRGVGTLLNSGNAVFEAGAAGRGGHGARIERALADSLGVSASVIVVTASEMDKIMVENPLVTPTRHPSRLLVAVPLNPALGRSLRPLAREEWGREALAVGSRAIYLWCPDGVLESRAAQAVSRELRERVTIRNWATMGKLQALMRKGPQ